MNCPACGRPNPDGAKFCNECAGLLPVRCSNCGTLNAPGSKFCNECAAALTAGPKASISTTTAGTRSEIHVSSEQIDSAIEGERKNVTALFADIKGSMELMEDLDPEEARAIVDPALKLMIDAVHRYGGYVVQSTGDGIFALFGAPVAHEDHPQRALYAALRMQDEIRRYSRKLRESGDLPIEARVGVNTGEVVVRSITTGAGHLEYTPIGHSVSLAARMQALSPTGSIATTDSTHRLCEGYFTFKLLGPTAVKGASGPVEVYEVTGLGPLRTRLQRAAARGLTRFVGREREMEGLKYAAERARTGLGQIVAVMADPGVGKSRLFFEFKAVSPSTWMVLESYSLSYGKASAYLPVIELLRNYFGLVSVDDERTQRERVAGKIAVLDRSLEDSLPYLLNLLGIVQDNELIGRMDGQIEKWRTLEAIKRILLRESLNQPLVVIFEDLHWIDEPTQEFLNLLADSIGTARILLLVNYRPEYSHRWGSKTYYTQLRLDPLGQETADEMLLSLLGDGHDLAPVKRLIIERTEGTPFFMEEMVQALFEDGVLKRNGAVKLAKPMNAVKVPTTVQAVLASRIDRLPSAEKELLQTLAVIGREFPLVLAEHVTTAPREELERMLSKLQLAEFVHEQLAIGEVEYSFKHALTHEVTYGSVLAERRRQIHDRTARALETINAQQLENHYGELARHYLLGNDTASAFRYVRLAADQSVNRAAYAEALSMVQSGLSLLDRLPHGAGRLRAEMTLRGIESTAAFSVYGGGSTEREHTSKRMCELGEQIGETAQVLRGLVDLSSVYLVRGECTRGFELTTRCLEMADPMRDAELLADIHWNRGLLANFGGDFQQAVSILSDGFGYAERIKRGYSREGFLFKASFKVNLANASQLLGRVSDAVKLADEALQHARDSRHLFSICFALISPIGALWRLEPEIIRAHTEEGITLAEKYGFALFLEIAHVYHGWAMAELGQVKTGVEEMKDGVASFRRMRGFPREQYAISLLADGYARLGRSEQALSMMNAALAHIEHTGQKAEQAEMLRLKGEVMLMLDRSALREPERCFRAAVDVARAQKAKWWELRTTVSLARLLRDTSRREEARTLLAEIYNWFTEGFDTKDLKEAKSLLDELSV
jgi:class 3 adenylate cyclase/tetratricopeptide (TPR) repeat protein